MRKPIARGLWIGVVGSSMLGLTAGCANAASEVGDGMVDSGSRYLYALFELSVRYLLDADGLGRPMHLVRDVMIDAGNGAVFATSFEHKFGIGLRQLEKEYWERVRTLLK